ncbi:K(lysine) acetyltransferase [Mortierella sp. GBA35]|nr:K(lysine) acetyltransferase [Mortierella sp. GBA35]
MDSKKDRDGTIEIGSFYAIIGKDLREYKVEVLGKRVSELDTDVYIHYDGTDKRLDEWVDITRLMPLKVTAPPAVQGASAPTTTSTSSTPTPTADASDTGRPKRKAIKDEVAALLDSMKRPTSRMRSGEVGQDGSLIKPPGHGHGHGNDHHHHHHDEEDVPQVRNVEWILYAGYDIATWYYSPYPDEYQDCQRLFICEYCLKYIRQVDSFINHTKTTCKRKKPPGTVVYSKGINKIYKVDGKSNKLYCQNLCLLAKLFLDNKTLYFDVPGFQFFVLTETRSGDRADVPVGFFSKEIVSYDGYNLACILVLPPFQRKSYGKLLIEFSYELTKIEGKVGSPEKPLSDLGKLGYVSYWITAILRELYPRPWPANRPPHPLPGRRRSRAPSGASGAVKPDLALTEGDASGGDASASTKVKDEKEEKGGKGGDVTMSDVTSKHRESMEVHSPLVSEPIATSTTTGATATASASTTADSALTAICETPTASTATSATTTQTQPQAQAQDAKEVAFSIRELAARTGIMEEDLMETLVTMGWMSHWQPAPAPDNRTTTLTAAVRQAKRNYRKLKMFQEQQQLFEKIGGQHQVHEEGHDTELSGGLGHHHHYHHHHHHSRHGLGVSHTSSSSYASGSMSKLGVGGQGWSGATAMSGAAAAVPAQRPLDLYSSFDQPLTHQFDPVSILDIPDGEDEYEEKEVVAWKEGVEEKGDGVDAGEDGKNAAEAEARGDEPMQGVVKVDGEVGVSSQQPKPTGGTNTTTAATKSASTTGTSGWKDVAVVTMAMVKEYQDRHNIRLEPYLDWNAIDWVAYRSTLEPPQ